MKIGHLSCDRNEARGGNGVGGCGKMKGQCYRQKNIGIKAWRNDSAWNIEGRTRAAVELELCLSGRHGGWMGRHGQTEA